MIPKPVILDISEWQVPSQIDYARLAQAVDGVIVRVQYGSQYEDQHYQQHIKEFQKHGVPIAVYAWVRGTSVNDMQQEASDFWRRAQGYRPHFWWLDVEERSMKDMRQGCEAYRQRLKQLGAKKVGAYIANHLYHQFNLAVDEFDGIWLPTYGLNTGEFLTAVPTATKNYDLHQYTSVGRLPGYPGAVDLNRLVNREFAYFFGQKQATGPIEKPTAPTDPTNQGGLGKMKTFVLESVIHLRGQAKTNAPIIALLQPGDQVKIDDIVFAEGYLWGVQSRNNGEKGYIAMGSLTRFGNIK